MASAVLARRRGFRRRGFISGIRICQAVLAVLILAGVALLADVDPLVEWWFWTATTTMITAAVAEPYYTGPVAALLYGVAGIGAGLAATRQGVEPLWIAYFVLASAVIVCAVIALVDQVGRAGELARWVATRFGRPAWLGLSAVAIELIRGVSELTLPTTALIGLSVLAATVISVPDWYRLIVAARPGIGGLTLVEAAVEPNLVLISGAPRLAAGHLVRVQGRGSADGVVVGNLAHRSGNRVQIALMSPWTDVVDAAGDSVDLEEIASKAGPVLGVAAAGSTDRVLDLRSFGALTRGATVYWTDPSSSRRYLHQVLGLDLRQSTWEGAAVIAEHARAGLLGTVETMGIVPEYRLPAPFAPVFSASDVTADLPGGFSRIGRIAGTQVPIGVSVENLRGHHLAVLGMSGMGKSTVARRLVDLLAKDGTVVAVDGTGEYKSRFSIPEWTNAVGLSSDGKWVYEPTGVQAQKAQEFIEQAMTAAASEYALGIPRNRTLLLEEAHSFLPEWNFVAARNEPEFVAKSCRYILQSRKFRLSFILISQRTAVISKSALSQCESYIIFRTLDDTSLQYVEGVVGSEFREVASGLKRYQAICVGPAFSTSMPVVVDLDPGDWEVVESREEEAEPAPF